MFEISQRSLKGLEVLEIKNTVNGEYINIIPKYGGAINEVVLYKEGQLFEIHKAAKSLKEFQEVSSPLYSGSFLAPFPNRVKNGKYQFNGVDYLLDLTDHGLPNALHGFLHELPFSVVSTDDLLGEVVLEHHFQGDKGYPFKLNFKNTYRLFDGVLKITSYVENNSKSEVPLGIGWHPYITTGTPVDLLKIKIPGKNMFKQDSNYIPTGEIVENIKFNELKTISNEFMNDCYEFDKDNKTVVYDPVKNLEIYVEQQMGTNAFNYCMYYTPPSRDCIAIEPMTCIPDAFNNKTGVLNFNKNQNIKFEFSIGLTTA